MRNFPPLTSLSPPVSNFKIASSRKSSYIEGSVRSCIQGVFVPEPNMTLPPLLLLCCVLHLSCVVVVVACTSRSAKVTVIPNDGRTRTDGCGWAFYLARNFLERTCSLACCEFHCCSIRVSGFGSTSASASVRPSYTRHHSGGEAEADITTAERMRRRRVRAKLA